MSEGAILRDKFTPSFKLIIVPFNMLSASEQVFIASLKAIFNLFLFTSFSISPFIPP